MSNKTMKQRIAVVAASALTAGFLSVASAPVANATAGDLTLINANGPVIAAGTVGATAAGTITIGSTTSIVIAFAAGTAAAGKATVEGGTITGASQATDAATGVSTATSFVYGDLVAVQLTFTPDAGVGVMVIRSYADGSTQYGTYTATVKAAASIGVVSATNSLVRVGDSTTDSGISSNVDSVTGGRSVAIGSNARINYSLKDGNNIAMPSTTAVTATATGGCVVDFANSASTLLAPAASELAVSGDIYVARSVANTPFTCTISITANGLPVATKTLTLQGKVTKIEVVDGQAGIANAYGSASTSLLAFEYNAYDAAGNVAIGIAPTSVTNNATLAFTSAQSTATATVSDAANGSITCSGATRGSGTFQLNYTNNLSESIKSAVYTANCFGTPVNYKASLDKASYVPGDIATLTITATDASGNPTNDYVFLGGLLADGTGATNPIGIAGSNLTAVTAPTSTDKFAAGKKTYKYVVGSTAGSYQLSVDLPKFNNTTYAQTAVTVGYKIASSGGVTNEEVLKSIVALIASINKQIQALQKLILKR